MPVLKNEADVESFLKLEVQLKSTRKEMAELSKKKPNDVVNKFKLGHLNLMLRTANEFLREHLPLEGFEEFDEAVIPSNSDVVFVLAQYTDAIYRFRETNTHFVEHDNYWKLSNGVAKVKSGTNHNFKYRD